MKHEFIDNGCVPDANIQIWVLMSKFPVQCFYPGRRFRNKHFSFSQGKSSTANAVENARLNQTMNPPVNSSSLYQRFLICIELKYFMAFKDIMFFEMSYKIVDLQLFCCDDFGN
jgi:hypothetical protein